jgi:hypothetical protein
MLFLGSPSGTFQSSTLEVKTGWSGLAVAGLWGDGRDQIIVSNGALDNDPKNQPGTITIFSRRR